MRKNFIRFIKFTFAPRIIFSPIISPIIPDTYPVYFSPPHVQISRSNTCKHPRSTFNQLHPENTRLGRNPSRGSLLSLSSVMGPDRCIRTRACLVFCFSPLPKVPRSLIAPNPKLVGQ